MAAQIDICNLALTKLGAQRITALTDTSTQARAMAAIYDLERRAEIRKYRWAFALKRATLPALADAPPFGFARAFQLPPDYLSLIQCGDIQSVPALNDYANSETAQWAIESGKLLTDFGAPVQIRYVRDVTDEGEMDALFVQSFASHLAYTTCEVITGSNTKRDAAAADYKQAIRDAIRINAIERAPMSINDDSWMVGRL